MKIYVGNEGGWESAFRDCRERDCPTIVHIRVGAEVEKWKLYPSGAASRIPEGEEIIRIFPA